MNVILNQKLSLRPFQSKVAKVSLDNSEPIVPLGMIIPNTKLSTVQCDLLKDCGKESPLVSLRSLIRVVNHFVLSQGQKLVKWKRCL